jgi:aspartyl-tRNA(Asn)/glutamyl-tRNA(Gln) amidotransferase subunit A
MASTNRGRNESAGERMTGKPADPALWSAVDLLAAYRAKSLSPREVAAACFARLKRFNPDLNAFTIIDEQGALAQAASSEARWAKGAPAGALDGVPVTIKDLVLTRGWPTLRGSRMVKRDQPWDDDGPIAIALRESNAVILGKTTSPEFGWKGLGDSPLTGITRNPWNRAHTTGGSSAGAAACAATGMGVLHTGSDGAGSIRIPSAFTGVFGLKPSFGRVPTWPPSPYALVSHAGPMTMNVADAALMMNVITREDARDPMALPPDGVDYLRDLDEGVRGLRIAFSPDLGYAQVDPDVAAALRSCAETFASLGARVERKDPGFANPRDAMLVLWQSASARTMSLYPKDVQHLADPGFIQDAADGARHSAQDYLAAESVRAGLTTQMNRFFAEWDLLILPTMPTGALPTPGDLRQGDRHWIDWSPFTYPFNMSRHPAASAPCGLTRDGLPVGLQIVGPMFQDARVLRAARAFEAARPFARPPGFA